MFRKVLIANRGEIAVRIAQTLQEMGIVAVAVCSDADRRSLHVQSADEVHPLEGASPGETYLDIHKILEAARVHHCDAIHPGYGFLSENEDFAQACQDAGVVFIGPTPQVIRSMGDKIVAKTTLARAGVPVVPGFASDGETDAAALKRAAGQIGYPVLLKAAAGGGGKGMRIVHAERELEPALEAAQREAGSAFGDARVFLEKYIERPRHIEFQIFGDTHGNVVQLFERECSIQRRYQKIVEESPSPALSAELRRRMGDAAVAAARAMGYTNAGTTEFIVDQQGAFYFLEVNTRLQVEHPVTELVTRQDLVRAQVLVAAGETLPFRQEDLRQDGHAIEVRIYAEDAARGFLPSIGVLERYVPPSGPNIRVDSGVRAGSAVTVHYDPMLSKLIVWAPNRAAAIARLAWALDRYVVLGVTTNIEFLRNLLDHDEFRAGRLHTHFLQEHPIAAARAAAPPDEALLLAALSLKGALGDVGGPPPEPVAAEAAAAPTPWTRAGRWRNT
jgi:acetyl-CoA carboxylase biotin carboxylase subunit